MCLVTIPRKNLCQNFFQVNFTCLSKFYEVFIYGKTNCGFGHISWRNPLRKNSFFYVVLHLLGTAKWTEQNSEQASLTVDKFRWNLGTNRLRKFWFEAISKNKKCKHDLHWTMEVQTNTHHLANLSKWSSPVAFASSSGIAPVLIQEFLNIFTLIAHVTR